MSRSYRLRALASPSTSYASAICLKAASASGFRSGVARSGCVFSALSRHKTHITSVKEEEIEREEKPQYASTVICRCVCTHYRRLHSRLLICLLDLLLRGILVNTKDGIECRHDRWKSIVGRVRTEEEEVREYKMPKGVLAKHDATNTQIADR